MAMGQDLPTIFVSYSHEDSEWVDGDSEHGLIPFLELKMRYEASFWYDRTGIRSRDFTQRISSAIERSRVALLLVTDSFFKGYAYTDELPQIARKAAKGGLVVLTILLSNCEKWQNDESIRHWHVVPGWPHPRLCVQPGPVEQVARRHQLRRDLWAADVA